MRTIANNKDFPEVWEEEMSIMGMVLREAFNEHDHTTRNKYQDNIDKAKHFLYVLSVMSPMEPSETKQE